MCKQIIMYCLLLVSYWGTAQYSGPGPVTMSTPSGASNVQWYAYTSSGPSVIPGATDSVYTSNTSGVFYAEFDNTLSAGCTDQKTVYSVLLHEGEILTLNVSTTPSGPATYVWKNNGAVLSGANTSTLQVTTGGFYTLEMTDSICTVESSYYVFILDNEDTDGDGIFDHNEPIGGINNPCFPGQSTGYTGYVASNAIWAAADCDGDGFTNGAEAIAGTDPYDEVSLPVGDLFPNYTFGNTSYLASNERFVLINLNEIRGFATTSAMQFFIPNVSGFQLDFDNSLTTATVLSPQSVNNNLWTVTNNGIGLLFSSNTMIPSGGRSRIALKVTALTPGSVANLTVNIAQGSGGEVNTGNNVGVLSKSIQN